MEGDLDRRTHCAQVSFRQGLMELLAGLPGCASDSFHLSQRVTDGMAKAKLDGRAAG